jgi:hypothetical protein
VLTVVTVLRRELALGQRGCAAGLNNEVQLTAAVPLPQLVSSTPQMLLVVLGRVPVVGPAHAVIDVGKVVFVSHKEEGTAQQAAAELPHASSSR